MKKPTISWDKFKGLALRGSLKVIQEEKKRENEVLIYLFFGIRGLDLMSFMNSRIYLCERVGVSIKDNYR